MNTPSLRRRVIVAGVTVTAIGLFVASAAVAVLYRQAMLQQLDQVLDERAQLVTAAADDEPDLADLADDLDRRGLRVTLTAPDGITFTTDPQVPRVGGNLPAAGSRQPATLVTRTIDLQGGATATISASRDGIDDALRRLLLVEFATALLALALVTVLLSRAARTALRPIDTFVHTANEIADGHLDRRLEPAQPTTELGIAAAAFDHMVDRLNTALDDATNANQTTRRFLDAAAHQLRTPLTGASTAIQTYRHRDPDRADDPLLTIVDIETRRAGRLVSDLLRLARIDHGQPLRPTDTNLRPHLEDETQRAARRAPHLQVQLDLDRAGVLSARVDPHATREIIANLLDNAIRYADEHIRLSATTTPDRIHLHIADDGPGISPEHRARLFERFATFDERSDTGLGLAIAHELAHAQHGDLTYDGRFTLSLPAAGCAALS